MFSIRENEIITVPLLVLVGGFFYFIFSYLFYGKSLQAETQTDNYKILITSKIFSVIIKAVLALSLIFAVVVVIYSNKATNDMYYIVYFAALILISCLKLIIYKIAKAGI